MIACITCQYSINNNGTSKDCFTYYKKYLGITPRCKATGQRPYKFYKPVDLKRLLYHIGNRKDIFDVDEYMLKPLDVQLMYNFWKKRTKKLKLQKVREE